MNVDDKVGGSGHRTWLSADAMTPAMVPDPPTLSSSFTGGIGRIILPRIIETNINREGDTCVISMSRSSITTSWSAL